MRTLTDVPTELVELARAQEGLLAARQCDAFGVTSHRRERLVRQGRWHRITHGVVDTSRVPPSQRDGPRRHEHLRRRAAWLGLLAYGPDAIAVGQCALVLLGVEGVRTDVVPEVTLPGARAGRSRDGIQLRQFDDGMTVAPVDGRPVATPDWALAQAVPEMGRLRAVAVMDSARHRRLITTAELAHAHDLARGRRGVARTHSWWVESDGRAESPLETFARLDCVDAGIAPDDLQVEVHDADRFLGRGDLGWRLPGGRWLIAELDGRDIHSTPDALLHDRARQNDLLASGAVDLRRFTGSDVTPPGAPHRGRLVHEIRRTLARERHHSPSNTT
ncbi:type IV toxin-antitoxin system AbiEi family antitoxin domain-containing protein [Cellulosimicrobium arenosum]|uniref:Type IV toxin-antitoxin system AbiEi family antitoxin domain-containing protein n=1 Tax=Cellulosimicrobium arenosum TaxID=2708133 RepID=A0A927PGB4_9MICO|nr:type IV toxin-antitoxin system AbiEi family antitoxin domain-containing protein [Cellulosimicrobium arenosum]MBD8080329.1 type IV toxin-antitoxin system AbiEi family antitoxin domain-containing protein [Cellulosimicrobium arenosum]